MITSNILKAKNIRISSDTELESDADGDKSDKLPVKIKILGNHIEVYSLSKNNLFFLIEI